MAHCLCLLVAPLPLQVAMLPSCLELGPPLQAAASMLVPPTQELLASAALCHLYLAPGVMVQAALFHLAVVLPLVGLVVLSPLELALETLAPVAVCLSLQVQLLRVGRRAAP